MKNYQSVKRLLLILTGSVFITELLVMFVVDMLPPLPRVAGFMLDAALLSTLIFPVFYIYVFRPLLENITELRRAEEDLRVVSVAFESKDPILITDADANILRANQTFLKLSGYSMEELIGQNPRIFQTGRYGKNFYEGMWKQLLQTGSWKGETRFRDKRGIGIPIGMMITAVKNELQETTHYVAIYDL